MNPLTALWVADSGSIYTVDPEVIKTPSGDRKVRRAIAFNVGTTLAKHIVDLHNKLLPEAKLAVEP